MPVQTRVEPKIKQVEPSSGSPTPCDGCGTATAKHMIDTCVVTPSEDECKAPTVARTNLCGTCVLGHDVAVLRDSGSWWFGEVKEYDNSQLHPFLMSFLNGDEEWTEISKTPSIDYLKFVGISQPQPEEVHSSPPNMMTKGSIGSFSSSSFSSESSFKSGKEEHAFPLFDDSKLIHLNQSFSSFDESVYSDDEGNIEVSSSRVLTTQLLKNDNWMEVVQSMITFPKPSTPKSSRIKSDGTNKEKKEKKKAKVRTPVMWTPEEDKHLQKVVDSFNEKDLPLKWPYVADQVENRNGKQCRERYINHVSPTLKSDVWSPEEDATVFASFFRIGKKWTKIAAMLRGRSVTCCLRDIIRRLYWYF